MLERPIDRAEDAVHGPVAVRVQDAEADELRVGSDAAELRAVTCDEAGEMSPVAARVEELRSVVHEVDAGDDRSGEGGVVRDAGVEQSDRHPAPRRGAPRFLRVDREHAHAVLAGDVHVLPTAGRAHAAVRRDQPDGRVGAERGEGGGAHAGRDDVDRVEGARLGGPGVLRHARDPRCGAVRDRDEGEVSGNERRIDRGLPGPGHSRHRRAE